MKKIRFEWDINKANSNLLKHNISFDEATSVFDDDAARLIYDPEHSENEDRFILLGLSYSIKVLVVVHCYKDSDNLIRIISARKASRQEAKQYKELL